MDKRTKEIILGQSMNQAIQLMVQKGLNPEDPKSWSETYQRFVDLIFDNNLELHERHFGAKKTETSTSAPVDDGKKECPKCKERIPSGFKKHFFCGWDSESDANK